MENSDSVAKLLNTPNRAHESTQAPRSGLLRARRVLTLGQSYGDSILWQNGKVVAVGEWRDLERLAPPDCPRLHLPGATVTPGLVDSHTHFTMWALARRQVSLVGVASREEAVARVSAAAPIQGWIQGQGWDANLWDRLPSRADLDHLTAPVYLDSLDVHAAWVNAAALALAGITRDTPDPPGGRIVRDGNGAPTGLLLERATLLVQERLPDPPPALLLEASSDAQREAHRLGITGIHNVEGTRAWETFKTMEREDRLRLRVLFHHPVAHLNDLVRRAVRSGAGSDWLTHGGVKLFLDGSLGSRTAWMLAPYEGSRDRGMPVTDAREAARAITTAADAGIAAAVHAIGDAAVRRALDLLTGANQAAIPHRIEHFQCVHPDDLTRAAAAGIVLSMQPVHLLTDMPVADRHWGARSAGAYALRTLRDTGATLALGSDTPVATLDPREGIYAAMARRRGAGEPSWYPEECLDLDTVLRGYTVGPALAAGVSDRRGRLEPGMDADLVVWRVPDAIDHGDPEAIRAGRVALTVVAGEAVYRDEGE